MMNKMAHFILRCDGAPKIIKFGSSALLYAESAHHAIAEAHKLEVVLLKYIEETSGFSDTHS